jgi:hypothetical protein
MPDPILILKAQAAAAALAAAVILLFAWPWRSPRPAWVTVSSALGVGVGFLLGCWLLDVRFRWPPRDCEGRWLLVLLPASVAVELTASLPGKGRWLVWPLRLVVAAGAARVLLHDSVYITDLNVEGTPEWAPEQIWQNLGMLAAALAAVWGSLLGLARRAPDRWISLAVALACGGAAITVMYSGYASGGIIGLPLAAVLGGAFLASLALSGRSHVDGVISLGVVGLFALVVVGQFFGKLTPLNAALLFFAPLACWLPDLPYVRRLALRLHGLARLTFTVVPVALALWLAQHQHAVDSDKTSSDSDEATTEDYMTFGK